MFSGNRLIIYYKATEGAGSSSCIILFVFTYCYFLIFQCHFILNVLQLFS